jgi:phosphoribosylcarboxyaminoimidazole (NCAIR) mutase
VSSILVPDVGVAGVLRLFSRLEEIERADVVIAVAGMEASLFSVLGGLVGRPIVAVPTSRGYGAALNGIASLLSAVNSCANGITAVNIDSGYAAAMAAYRMLSGGPRRWDRKSEEEKSSPPPSSTRRTRAGASTASARRRSSSARRRRSK